MLVTGKPCGPALALVEVVLAVVDGVLPSLPLLNAPETARTIATTRTAPLPRATSSWVCRLEKVAHGPRGTDSALEAPWGDCSAVRFRRRRSGIGSRRME